MRARQGFNLVGQGHWPQPLPPNGAPGYSGCSRPTRPGMALAAWGPGGDSRAARGAHHTAPQRPKHVPSAWERLELPLTYGELPTVYSEMAHTIHDTQGTRDRGERTERTRGTRTSRHEGRECRECVSGKNLQPHLPSNRNYPAIEQ